MCRVSRLQFRLTIIVLKGEQRNNNLKNKFHFYLEHAILLNQNSSILFLLSSMFLSNNNEAAKHTKEDEDLNEHKIQTTLFLHLELCVYFTMIWI